VQFVDSATIAVTKVYRLFLEKTGFDSVGGSFRLVPTLSFLVASERPSRLNGDSNVSNCFFRTSSFNKGDDSDDGSVEFPIGRWLGNDHAVARLGIVEVAPTFPPYAAEDAR
jgi:hypothetical protein